MDQSEERLRREQAWRDMWRIEVGDFQCRKGVVLSDKLEVGESFACGF